MFDKRPGFCASGRTVFFLHSLKTAFEANIFEVCNAFEPEKFDLKPKIATLYRKTVRL